jgi:hypothetical protein
MFKTSTLGKIIVDRDGITGTANAPLGAPSNPARHRIFRFFFVVSFLNSLLSLFGGGVLASVIEALNYWLHEVKHILNLLTSL